MQRIIVLLSLLLISTIVALAQDMKTIRGRVLDKDSKFPITGASILVLGTDSVNGTLTDDNGFFKLTVPLGRVSLRISYLGYKISEINDLLVISGKENQLNIELEEKVSQI